MTKARKQVLNNVKFFELIGSSHLRLNQNKKVIDMKPGLSGYVDPKSLAPVIKGNTVNWFISSQSGVSSI